MLNFSYSSSPRQKRNLEDIEITRNKILLQLISPKDEIRLRYETSLQRIRAALKLTGIEVTLKDLTHILASYGKKRIGVNQQAALDYKRAYDYIRDNWLNMEKPITAQALDNLNLRAKPMNLDYKSTKQMLEFIQVGPPEYPAIQAGIVFITLSDRLPKWAGNIRFLLLTSVLFLYKYGFDFRGILNLEEFIENDLRNFQKIVSEAHASKNITNFLEYFINAVAIESDKALIKIRKRKFITALPESYYDLTQRQREILSLLEQPGARISNKTVQRYFKVSQITSFRDLTKLASLGILFVHGKGRSVYYTKV